MAKVLTSPNIADMSQTVDELLNGLMDKHPAGVAGRWKVITAELNSMNVGTYTEAWCKGRQKLVEKQAAKALKDKVDVSAHTNRTTPHAHASAHPRSVPRRAA